MGLRDWWKRRQQKKLYEDWLQHEQSRLDIQERKTLLKTAKVNLQFQRLQLKLLRKEEKREPKYIR